MVELTRRYAVMTMATEAPFDLRDPEGVFVLKPWKDPAALRALRAYAECCYPELARDLGDWIRAIEREPGTRGDIGRRNEAHIARTAAPRKKAARASKPRRAAKKAARGTKKRRRS